ncbi:hypothetical protein [Arthrobacter flavus]|uniref:Asparagine synthetase domain-containing protein n=1 Tax=Arthrobacter flavus TaxID=95172 RepID=A0ABW4Q8P3_9MICC
MNAMEIRKSHASEHFQKLNKGPVLRTEAGDGGSGFIGWVPESLAVDWRFFQSRDNAGVAWLHIPSLAGGPESGVDAWGLGQAVLDGQHKSGEIGAPFAVARWQNGQLDIANDMLGLVRLFHFSFDGGDVWTTRPGLAHIFMGEIPKKNRLAWGGMATLGWASSGTTQLGDGRQLPGGSYVSGGIRNGQRFLSVENVFNDWLRTSRETAEPSPAASVRDMELYMSTAKRWPRQAMADLSGGKDSRVVAAIGIRSNALKGVRTIATDHGEVETAQHLMSLIDTNIEHRIDARKDPSRPGSSFVRRLGSQHQAWEGRFLATTAYNSAEFEGFAPLSAPMFNGLGGEVMAGGNLLGAWHDRLINAPGPAARDKLATMVKVATGASEETKEMVIADIQEYVNKASEMGLNGAAGVMDIFYHLDKMPNWSIPYATPHTLTPLFAPSLLTYAAQRTGKPVEYGEAHRRLLREAIPEWAYVPFYKPTAQKRAVPFIWQNGDWEEIRAYITEHLDQALSFSPDLTNIGLGKIDAGEGTKREEIFVQRLIWEITFDSYLQEIEEAAKATSHAIKSRLAS